MYVYKIHNRFFHFSLFQGIHFEYELFRAWLFRKCRGVLSEKAGEPRQGKALTRRTRAFHEKAIMKDHNEWFIAKGHL